MYHRTVAEIDAAWQPGGRFDLKRFLGEPPPPQHADAWELYVIGHLLEVAMDSDDAILQAPQRLDRALRESIELLRRQDSWAHPARLLTSDSPFDYAAAAHYVSAAARCAEHLDRLAQSH